MAKKIKINVKYYSGLDTLLGTKEAQLKIKKGATLKDLVEEIEDTAKVKFKKYYIAYIKSKNSKEQIYQLLDEKIKLVKLNNGDKITFYSAIAGG